MYKIPKAMDKEFICPESKQTWYSEFTRCNLNDKICLLETGEECPYYQEFKEEFEKEEAM